ncbi:putative capsular polysaccharide synthesis family protein [Sinomicrobium oceani]|uniref:putative capsular polysaccharide synthesis family protein n=1 Tax=Sinomicrobium oceani TaxID=1150368 RepID=UPI002279FA48|nr:putative capsular polysaccharide synthesis family protein [Sinomicrobium oceani]
MKIIELIKKYLDANDILIYQMGKVGSTSLENSLSNSTHFHTLYDRRLCQFYIDSRQVSKSVKIKHYLLSRLRVSLIKRRKKVKIITLVRNPYDRNVSHFFQDLQFWLSYHSLKKEEFREENKDLIKECFEESFNFDYATNWFKEEIERFCGIKIQEDCEFDISKGVGTVIKGKYELLILRTDKLDNLEEEIAKFVGYKVVINRTNVGEAKWYSCVYKEFKNSYIPSETVLYNTFDTDWVKKLFSENERDAMIEKARNFNNKHKTNIT